MQKSVEESLRKLQTDYIGSDALHQPFSDYYGSWRALEDLYDEGKLRAIGISNFTLTEWSILASHAFVQWLTKSRYILITSKK